MDRINIGGLNICNVTMSEAVNICIHQAKSNSYGAVYTPNAEMSKAALDDPAFMKILNSGMLVIPDGAGVVLASKILKTPLKEKVGGCDLATKLLPEIEKYGLSLFLFGGKVGVAEKAAENIRNQHPSINICGTLNGYFTDVETPLETIISSRADIVFVCLGFPKQEKFIYENIQRSGARLMLGLGGTLDALSGEVKRAPDFFVKNHLEWLYRGALSPKRYKRLLKIPLFLIDVVKIKFRRKKCK